MIGVGTGTGKEAGSGSVTRTSTLTGEVVKITCDGSYDSYYCCATESANSLEESSLASQLRKIPWYASTLVVCI